MAADLDAPPIAEDDPPRGGRRPVTVVLVALLGAAALVIAGTVGWLVRGDGASGDRVTASSVDAGFARDMSTHHTQAVTMAGYERDNTTNPSLKILAFDIETSQQFQLGQMQGWLDGWKLGRQSSIPQMQWMGHAGHLEDDGLMPGMATPAQMSKLESSHGTALDILFLQLMIHHHQGGLPMAQSAADHARTPQVQTMATAIVTVQSNEIVVMEQLLRQLGGSPLPPPAS
jgi:uncharacterized protein (DUF305 family)